MSFEGSGTVSAVGSGVIGFHAGDNVMFLAPGSVSRTQVLLATSCIKLPEEIDLAAATSLIYTYGSAYLAVAECARIQNGDVSPKRVSL